MYCDFLKNENGNAIKNATIIRWGDCGQFYTLQSYNDIITEYNADMKTLTIAPQAFATSPTTKKTLILFLKKYLHFDAEQIDFIICGRQKKYYIVNCDGLTITIRREKIQ